MDRETRQKFKTKIKHLAEESREARAARRTALTAWREDRSNAEADQEWRRQHRARLAWRFDARCYLLAYAYLRGVPYWVLEAKTNEPFNSCYVSRAANAITGEGINGNLLDAWRDAPRPATEAPPAEAEAAA